MIGSKQDWFNLNSLRSYPLDYNSPVVSGDGFILPDSLIVDCMVVAQAASFQPYLSSIHFSGSVVTAVFFDLVSNQDAFMAQASISEDYTTANIISLGSVPVSGRVTFGELGGLSVWSKSGIHIFPSASNSLINHCFMACGAPVVGQVGIAASGSLAISVSPQVVNGITTYNIIFYLTDPNNYVGPCQPAQTLCDCFFQPIKKINTVSPDANGNINLVVDPALGIGFVITSAPGNIILSFSDTIANACNTTQTLPFSDGRLPSEANLTS